jgi:hypothetical protein
MSTHSVLDFFKKRAMQIEPTGGARVMQIEPTGGTRVIQIDPMGGTRVHDKEKRAMPQDPSIPCTSRWHRRCRR